MEDGEPEKDAHPTAGEEANDEQIAATSLTTHGALEEERDDGGQKAAYEAEAEALTAWVQAADRAKGDGGMLSRVVQTVDDLYDGVAFFDILATVDAAYFRNPHGADVKDNWVLKTATLKRLYKLMTQYYIEVLQQSPDALDVPDLDALARDGSQEDLCKLGRLAIGIAVRSEKANEHIEAIQSLQIENQQQLMYTIEQIMSSLRPLEDEDEDEAGGARAGQSNPEHEDQTEQQKRQQGEKADSALQTAYDDLLERHRTLQAALDEMQAEKEETAKEMAQFREKVEQDRIAQADVLMRQEIEKLKADLRRSEDNLAEAESEVERLGSSVSELTKKSEELQRKSEENVKLKDQLEELKHASDKLQRTENVMEKYKKKLEEGTEVRRQLKLLEQQNVELVDRNAALEDEYKRIAHFKPLMDSYKGQIADLEAKVSSFQRDLNAARYDSEQTSAKLRATEEARTKEKEELDLYQERIQELELSGGLSKRKGERGNVNGAEGLAANNEAGSDEEPDEILEDALSGTTMAGLKIQVRKLMRELKVAQSNKADAGRLLVAENLLQDANKMKDRYEKDFLKEYQISLRLRKQLEAIQSGKADVGDGPEANLALRMRLNETVEELDKAQKALGELQVEHDQATRELTVARSDLTLVDKDKLEMIEEVRASVNVEKAELERSLKQSEESVREKEEQIRMQLSQINTLLLEKVDLQNDGITQRDGALQRELEMGDLRASLQDRSSSEGVKEPSTELEARLQTTQEKLQKARMFIRQQDKMIKDATSRRTAAPDELVRRAQTLEQENKQLRLEQKLMAAAWYDLNHRLMRNGASSSSTNGMAGGGDRSGTMNAGRAHTKASVELHGLKPKSWLMQQRSQLTGGIMLARR